MDLLTIEKGVPMPVGKHQDTGVTALMRRMEIGDSVVVPKRMYMSIASLAKQAGIKIRQRSVPEGVRFWRVA